MITPEQLNIISILVQKYIDKANKYFEPLSLRHKIFDTPIQTLKPIIITYSLKGSSAGTANYYTNTVNFNKVLMLENFDYYIDHTVGHEVAHIVVEHFYGSSARAHGREWKYVMKSIFNIKADRCHNLNIKNTVVRNTKKYIYKCKCETMFNISTQRHKKIKMGKIYLCSTCKATLKYTNNTTDKRTLLNN